MKKYKEAELFEALTDFHDSCIRQGHTNHEENAKYFMEENEEYDLDYYQIMGMLKDMDKEMTIKESRAKAGLTQQKMSDKLGIPKRTIEDWERGRRTPPAWAEKLVKKELERMNDKKYIVIDSTIEHGGMDEWHEIFETKEDANERAKAIWVSELTDKEREKRHVYVLDVKRSDLEDPEDWETFFQGGYEEDRFDSES